MKQETKIAPQATLPIGRLSYVKRVSVTVDAKQLYAPLLLAAGSSDFGSNTAHVP